MANLRETRRKLRLLIIVLLCLNVVAALLLMFPIGGSAQERDAHSKQLWAELQAKTRETAPLQDIDKKVDQARADIATFYQERLPTHQSQVADTIGKLAAENSVRIVNADYDTRDAQVGGLQRLFVDASLDGDYLQEVKFINALERSKLFFVVDNVTLNEVQGGRVKLQVRFETYLRPPTTGA